MPIVTGIDRAGTNINGSASAGNSLLLNSLHSIDDEESFVVLERCTANDMSIIGDVTPLPQSQIQSNGPTCSFPAFMTTSTSTYMSAGINTSSTISNPNQKQPRVGDSSRNTVDSLTPVLMDPIAIPYDNTNLSVSVEEIDRRLQEVLHENINLKENLYQTNLAMKEQLSTVRLLQDRALATQKQHQAKFEETKALIVKLGSEKNELQDKLNQLHQELNKVMEENKELKETNLGFGTEAAKLLTENASLQKQLASVQESLESAAEKEKKVSLQTAKETELREVVDQLTRKLEAVERARRQQDFDIDKLQAQLARSAQDLCEAQRKAALSEQALQSTQTSLLNENALFTGEKLTKNKELLEQLKSTIQEEQTRFNSLNSWLTLTDPKDDSAQFEISELRHLLAEEQTQSVARKQKLYQAVATIHELLADMQKLQEELEKVKADHAVKESHGLVYDEMQKKGFRERLDSLTAKLVEREEALVVSERHLASLQEAVRLQNDEKKGAFTFLGMFESTPGEISTLKEQVKTLVTDMTAKDEELALLRAEVQTLRGNSDTIAVLEEQAKIFQTDFEAERRSRESLVEEKERLLEDLRHLQRRNHELIEELNNSRGNHQANNTASENQPLTQTVEPMRARQQERSPSPPAIRPQDEAVPPPKRFYCPNPECNMMFTTVEPLQLHVITCLKLDD